MWLKVVKTPSKSICNKVFLFFYSDRFNPAIKDFVLKLPGITSKNVYSLLNKVDSLAELVTLTAEQLEEVLQSKEAAKELHDSLHRRAIAQDTDAGEKKEKKKPAARFKTRKKK